MHHPQVAVLFLRVVFGLFMAAHGINKVFGGGRIAGTAGWFGSIGFKWPVWQARLAAATEIGAGVFLALGLLTSFAAGAMVALMVVAIWVAHRNNGFFVFKPGQGWEYCASIAAVSLAIGTTGGGRFSLDHAIGLHLGAAAAIVVTFGIGFIAPLLQLGVSYRPTAR